MIPQGGFFNTSNTIASEKLDSACALGKAGLSNPTNSSLVYGTCIPR